MINRRYIATFYEVRRWGPCTKVIARFNRIDDAENFVLIANRIMGRDPFSSDCYEVVEHSVEGIEFENDSDVRAILHENYECEM